VSAHCFLGNSLIIRLASRTLPEWLDHLSRLHPRDIELGLERVAAVWRALGAPAPAPRIVTVAGTNGKGSSVAFLEAILGAAGYRVGAYTSPHLLDYNERVRIEGLPVPDAILCESFERIEQARGDTPLTYFEFGTLAALWCFAQAGLDAAILEVGLGGRLDAVNIVDADVGLITGIALDHTDWLGDDLEAIGFEKAGIARPGRPLVYGAREMPDAVARVAEERGARLLHAGRDYDWRQRGDGWEWHGKAGVRPGLPLPSLRGAAQLQNAAGVLAVLSQLPELPVDAAALRAGLLEARLPGRFDVRHRRCPWVLDVAHNPQAAEVLAAQLGERFVTGERHAVVGMLADKAIEEVLAALAPRVDHWHLLDLGDQPRGASAQALLDALPAAARAGAHCCTDVDGCLTALDTRLGADDEVLVFGSFVTVGQVMAWLDVYPSGL